MESEHMLWALAVLLFPVGVAICLFVVGILVFCIIGLVVVPWIWLVHFASFKRIGVPQWVVDFYKEDDREGRA